MTTLTDAADAADEMLSIYDKKLALIEKAKRNDGARTWHINHDPDRSEVIDHRKAAFEARRLARKL